MNIATYQTTPEKHGDGIQTVLYIRGSEEANKYWNEKLKGDKICQD